MNGREKISARDRRDIVLAVLYEGEPQITLARQYGIDKGHVSRLVSQAKGAPEANLRNAEEALREAEDEVAFRRRVLDQAKLGEEK